MKAKNFRYTILFGTLAAGLSLINMFLFGNDILFMYLISPTSWFIALFQNIPDVARLYLTYVTTIPFWALAGYWIDRMIATKEERQPEH
jgi:hypothetical protein